MLDKRRKSRNWCLKLNYVKRIKNKVGAGDKWRNCFALDTAVRRWAVEADAALACPSAKADVLAQDNNARAVTAETIIRDLD